MLNIDSNKFYSIKDAAQIFDVHPMTVYKWVSHGKLPIIEIRGRIYISGETIIKLIRAAVRIRQAAKKSIETAKELLPEDIEEG